MSVPSSAATKIAEWRARPRQMVHELFGVTPDAWQADALDAFPTSPQLVMRACKGPGKTATLAWLGWNFMLTRPHARVGCTSISGANLKAGLWTELAMWRNKAALLKTMFEQTTTEIYARDHRETWKMEARTWAQDASADQIGNALAGLHSQYVMWLGDEAGSYPPAILPTMQAIFAGNPIEAHVVLAGNPNTRSGALFMACIKFRDQWRVIEITGDPDDPKRSPRISIDHARAMIMQYGRDNPWVKVDILGQFPDSDINTLIGIDALVAATNRVYHEQDIMAHPRILSADVAREGDDESVLYSRQGLVAFEPQRWRNIDGIQGGGAVAAKWRDWDADACFIDDTGGFGASWIDNLRLLGRQPIGVGFARQAHNPVRYFNKRAEMYFEGVQWIKDGGQIPNVARLLTALSEITYTHRGDRLLLEDKKLFKLRMGWSPDDADAFVTGFAEPVASRIRKSAGRKAAVLPPYDPYAHLINGIDQPQKY